MSMYTRRAIPYELLWVYMQCVSRPCLYGATTLHCPRTSRASFRFAPLHNIPPSRETARFAHFLYQKSTAESNVSYSPQCGPSGQHRRNPSTSVSRYAQRMIRRNRRHTFQDRWTPCPRRPKDHLPQRCVQTRPCVARTLPPRARTTVWHAHPTA